MPRLADKEGQLSQNLSDECFVPPFSDALVEACEMVCLGTEHTDEFTYLVDEFSEEDGSLFDAFLGLHIDRFGADPGYLPVVPTLAEIRKARSVDVE